MARRLSPNSSAPVENAHPADVCTVYRHLSGEIPDTDHTDEYRRWLLKRGYVSIQSDSTGWITPAQEHLTPGEKAQRTLASMGIYTKIIEDLDKKVLLRTVRADGSKIFFDVRRVLLVKFRTEGHDDHMHAANLLQTCFYLKGLGDIRIQGDSYDGCTAIEFFNSK